jgi:hypothetical protein
MKIKKNGKVINLTESDLRRIVTKVIKEQDEAPVADAAEGGKKNWKFTIKSPKFGFTSEILISMYQNKDPKTKKMGQPVYSINTRKEGEKMVYVGKIGIGVNNINFPQKRVLMKNVGAMQQKGIPDPAMSKELTKGFKDSIGLDINFENPK